MKPLSVIGIAGGTCSGKTLVAKRIVEKVGEENVLICNQDNYYRDLGDFSPAERANWNFDHPNAFDHQLLVENMTSLSKGTPADEPIYSFIDHTRTGKFRHLLPKPIMIIEGILVLGDPDLRKLMDIKIFVDEESDIRLARRLRRDEVERGRTSESVLDQYLDTVRPMHQKYVTPTKEFADIIIPRGGENLNAISIFANHLRMILENRADVEVGQ
ncbi:uridine kinase [bacterium]|nr:uridine kinase [bacterium]